MGIDDLRQQFYARLESGELGKGANNYGNGLLGTGGGINFRSKSGAAAAMARTAQTKPKSQKPAKPDLVALTGAAKTWSRKSTNADLDRCEDVIRDKMRVIREFFLFLDKDLLDVAPTDVESWLEWLKKKRGLAATTVYNYCSHLCSFFDWITNQPELAEFIRSNPVRPAFVKKPRPYQSRLSRALDDTDLKALWEEMERVRADGTVTGLRDYSLFVFFAATGDRRAEITNLRGLDIKVQNNIITYYPRAKGGKRAGKVIDNPLVAQALLDYLAASGRRPEQVFGRDVPLWQSHDRGRGGRFEKKKKEVEKAAAEATTAIALSQSKPKPPKPSGLTSHSFARLMKSYATRAGIYDFNLHKIRHTFARIVNEDTRSLSETQAALGHQSPETTRLYVPNITIQANAHSSRLQDRIGI